MDLSSIIIRANKLCEIKGIDKRIYTKSGAGKDFISNIKKGSTPSIDKVLALAVYLDCSVDYLLGRIENPNAHKAQNSYAISNRDTVVNGTQANVINNEAIDSEVMELAQLIKSLPIIKRAEAILAVEEIKNK